MAKLGPYAANTIIVGDCLEVLRQIPDGVFQMCATSPPYWGLRDYGIPPVVYGGDPLCEHEWGAPGAIHAGGIQKDEHGGQRVGRDFSAQSAVRDRTTGQFCHKCGAWLGSLGLEPTPELYVEHIVEVFREVKRVLRDDGVLWLNMGDSYATHASKRSGQFGKPIKQGFDDIFTRKKPTAKSMGLKEKDLCGIPGDVVRALRAPYYTGRIKAQRDRVWLAAVLDTDGSICGFRHIRKDNGSERTGIHITVTNCNTRLLDECFRIWPTSKRDHNKHGEGHYGSLPTYRWIAHNVDKKAQLLRELYPYFVGKQKQALLAWNLLELSRDAKRLGKSSQAQAVRDKRRHIVELVSKLNHYQDVDIPDWIRELPPCYEPGWYWRSDIIWAKGVSFLPDYAGSCMPESVRDRPTKSHEYVFLLTKSRRYFYDQDAIREPLAFNRWSMSNKLGSSNRDIKTGQGAPGQSPHSWERKGHSGYFDGDGKPLFNPAGRNLRTVWVINPKPFPEAHFATFPPKLVEPMIKAGTSELGACPECGKAWARVVERTSHPSGRKVDWREKAGWPTDAEGKAVRCGNPIQDPSPGAPTVTTIGWQPACSCCDGLPGDVSIEMAGLAPIPCIVLDPFAGAGTTLMVADGLGLDWVGIDISAPYCEMAVERIANNRKKGAQLELPI